MTDSAPGLMTEAPQDGRFVEVLTTEISGAEIGYRYGGSFPGPNALVAGTSAMIEALSDRLLLLPTLPWMWGKLYLVRIDGIEFMEMRDARSALPDVWLDDMIMLPQGDAIANWPNAVDQAYWTTLRLCRRLGMIEGRGIVGH